MTAGPPHTAPVRFRAPQDVDRSAHAGRAGAAMLLLSSCLAALPAPAQTAAGAAPAASGTAAVPDAEREQALAQQIESGLDASGLTEAVRIAAAGTEFLGLFHPAGGREKRGAAVILPDVDRHPDWPTVVRPMRLGLPAGGWATLSVQLPLLAPGTERAAFGDSIEAGVERARAAVEYLRGREHTPVVLIGHGLGAIVALRCATGADACGAAAVALVSVPEGSVLDPPAEVAAWLQALHLPVLDVYGSRDLDAVVRGGPRRTAAGGAGGAPFRQLIVDGADHEFSGIDDLLVRYLRGWLDQVVGGGSAAAAGSD